MQLPEALVSVYIVCINLPIGRLPSYGRHALPCSRYACKPLMSHRKFLRPQHMGFGQFLDHPVSGKGYVHLVLTLTPAKSMQQYHINC